MSSLMSEMPIVGKINICKKNAAGEITWEEEVKNDIVDATRLKLMAAMIDWAYDWDGTTATNQLAFDGYVSSGPWKCANLSGSTNYSPDSTAIVLYEKDTNDKVVCKSDGAATKSSNVITHVAYVTGLGSTIIFDEADWGILTTFAYSGAGSMIWMNQWATGSFTEVSVQDTDVLTITWTMTIG